MTDYMKEIAKRTKAGFGMVHRELLQWFRETQTGTLSLRNTLQRKNTMFVRSLKRKGSKGKNAPNRTLEGKTITPGEKKGGAEVVSIKTNGGNKTLISGSFETLTKKNIDSDAGYDILHWDIETAKSRKDKSCDLGAKDKPRAYQNIDNSQTTVSGDKIQQVVGVEDKLHTYQNIDIQTTVSQQASGTEDKLHTYEQIDSRKTMSRDVLEASDKPENYETIWEKSEPQLTQPLQSVSENNPKHQTDTNRPAISPSNDGNCCDENEYIEADSAIGNSAISATVEPFITKTTLCMPIHPGPRPFLVYTVEEVVDCFEECALSQLADICKSENLDGEYFRSLSDEDLVKEPFYLTCFHISKVRKIIAGWRPKRTPLNE